MGENRFCTNCGAELADDAAFCINCGQPVEAAGTDPMDTAVMPDLQEAFPETQPEPAYPQQPATDPFEPMGAPFQPSVSTVSGATQYTAPNVPTPAQYAVPVSPPAATPMPTVAQEPKDSSRIITTVSIVIITLSLVASVGALVYLFMPTPNNAQQQGAAASNVAGGNTGNAANQGGSAGGSGSNGSNGTNGTNGTNGNSNSGSGTSGSPSPTQQPPTTNTTNTTPTTTTTTTSQQQADSQFRSELVSYYNRLSDYDSRVASAADTFNNNFLSSSMSARQSYASSCSSLLSEIQQQSYAFSSLSVPAGSSYAEQYKLIRQCYQDLVERADCLNRGWQISIRYSNPSAHEDEILEPIRSNASGGNNVYYTDYNNTYPKIRL